jgi:hypothetical protein
MAGVILAASLAGAAAITKGIMGITQTAKANKALDKFKRQELRNVTEGMRVSTLEAQFNTQEAQRRYDTAVDALRSGGVRGIVGGLGRQEMLAQNVQQRASAGLDQQQVMIDRMRAQDEARIRGMQEQRDSFDQQVLLGQKAAGRQATMSAVGDLASAGAFFAMNYEGGGIDFSKNATRSFMPPPPTNSTNFFGGGAGSRFYGPAITPPPPAEDFSRFTRAGDQMNQPEYFDLSNQQYP